MAKNRVALRNVHLGHDPLPPLRERGINSEVSRQSPHQRGDSGTKTEISQEEGLQTRKSRRIETASNKESPGHEVAAIQLPSRPAFSNGMCYYNSLKTPQVLQCNLSVKTVLVQGWPKQLAAQSYGYIHCYPTKYSHGYARTQAYLRPEKGRVL